jgi:hypothetical protein
MSIRETIQHRIGEGRLFLLPPALPSDPSARSVFISEEIRRLTLGPWLDEKQERRWGRVRADLDSFTIGQLISIGHKNAYMSRLEKPEDEVWDIRCRDPSPGIRVFGRFAEQDIFIALTQSERKPLGDRNSAEWEREIKHCQAEWRKLFHPYQPVSGVMPDDYISDNVHIV